MLQAEEFDFVVQVVGGLEELVDSLDPLLAVAFALPAAGLDLVRLLEDGGLDAVVLPGGVLLDAGDDAVHEVHALGPLQCEGEAEDVALVIVAEEADAALVPPDVGELLVQPIDEGGAVGVVAVAAVLAVGPCLVLGEEEVADAGDGLVGDLVVLHQPASGGGEGGSHLSLGVGYGWEEGCEENYGCQCFHLSFSLWVLGWR